MSEVNLLLCCRTCLFEVEGLIFSVEIKNPNSKIRVLYSFWWAMKDYSAAPRPAGRRKRRSADLRSLFLGCASPFGSYSRPPWMAGVQVLQEQKPAFAHTFSLALLGCRTCLFEVEGSNFLRRNKKPGFDIRALYSFLVGHEGFEPSTNGLRVHCSTS